MGPVPLNPVYNNKPFFNYFYKFYAYFIYSFFEQISVIFKIKNKQKKFQKKVCRGNKFI